MMVSASKKPHSASGCGCKKWFSTRKILREIFQNISLRNFVVSKESIWFLICYRFCVCFLWPEPIRRTLTQLRAMVGTRDDDTPSDTPSSAENCRQDNSPRTSDMSISDSDSDASSSSNSSSNSDSDSSKENVNTEQRPTAPAVPVRDPQPPVDETAAYDDDAGDITSAVQLKACFFLMRAFSPNHHYLPSLISAIKSVIDNWQSPISLLLLLNRSGLLRLWTSILLIPLQLRTGQDNELAAGSFYPTWSHAVGFIQCWNIVERM